jgi:hypothetical protein
MSWHRAGTLLLLLVLLGEPAWAGTVIGKLDIPAGPERPASGKGFLDRMENPFADVKKVNYAPYLVAVLEPASGAAEQSSQQVVWELVGESFAHPVIAVPVGAEVVIKNVTKAARTITAVEDPKLVAGPLNPTATKSFRASAPAVYTFRDADAPHLHGKVVVVGTRHVANVDDNGKFEMTDVPDGAYKLRVYFYDVAGKSDWLPATADVNVVTKGRVSKAEVNLKLPALAPAPKK